MPTRILGEHEHLQHGGLHGWCEACPPEDRHRALERAVHADGYATVARRLNLLAIYAKRENPHLHRLAKEDAEWLHDRYRDGETRR